VQQRSLIARDAAATTAREAEAHLAALQARRQDTLARQHVTSDQLQQSAQADRSKSVAGVAQARATLAASRAQVQVLATEREAAIADLAKARGMLQQARAALAAARLDLERTVIRAPVDGTVGQRALRVGHYADVGTPLMAVVPMAPYVVANYKETQTDRIRPGQRVEVSVDALGGAVLKGRVDSFAPASGAQFALLPPDNATGNFTKIVQRIPLRIVSMGAGKVGRSAPRHVGGDQRGHGHERGAAGRSRLPARLGGGAGGRGGLLYGGDECACHQCLAARCARVSGRVLRGRIVDHHRLSGGRDHRHPHDRLAGQRVFHAAGADGGDGGFVVFSILCSTAPDITTMIAARALQGAFGGVLIPLSLQIIVTELPASKHPFGMALFAVSNNVAQAAGPSLGAG
jgi:hypothetical protein